jgi:hypothetical protein
MTSCADLTKNLEAQTTDSAADSGTGEAEHYFKSSWPENGRPKEAYIIREAGDRVRKFLPRHLQHFVLD